MTLRKKIFFIVAYSLEVVLIALYGWLGVFFLGRLVENEQRSVQGNVEWTGRAIDRDIRNMDHQLFDWSQWDDMYAFADSPTKEFIDSNLPVESLDVLDVNFVVVADREGNVLAERGMDQETRKEIPVPGDIDNQLKEGSLLSTFDSLSRVHSGMIQLSSGPAFIATRPIMTSHGEGPSRGTIAFVMTVNDSYRYELSNFLGYPVSFELYGSKNFPADFSSIANTLVVSKEPQTVVGEATISGYGFVSDVFGSPLLFYKVERAIPTAFGVSKIVVILSLLGFFLVSTALIFFLLHWTVLSRVNYLSRSLAQAREKGISKSGIEFSGSDEIAKLAGEINAMLRSLLQVRERGDLAERRFQTIADTMPAFLWMIDRNRACLYANKQTLSLVGEVSKEHFTDVWQKSIHPDDEPLYRAQCLSAFENRKPLRMEYRVALSKNRYRWMLDNSVPFSSSSGVFLGFLHTAIDITDRKELEEAEVQKRKDTERLNAIMVSRELRMVELKKEIGECRRLIGKNHN